MVSMRGLQSSSSVLEAERWAAAALTSATESTSSTGTATTSAPLSSFKSVTTKKETSSSGEVITTVTTTTTSVNRSSNASSTTSSTSNTANTSGTTSESNTATEREAGSVSITTITTESENGSAPVTTITTEKDTKTTRTSTTKDLSTGITTVTTTTESDTDMNGSASSSTTRVTTSGGSSGGASTTERSTTSETSNATSSSAFASTTTAASSAGAMMEGASSTTSTSTSTTSEGDAAFSTTGTNNGSSTSATTSTEGSSVSTTSGTAATPTITATGSTATSSSIGPANENMLGAATSFEGAGGSATTSSAIMSSANGSMAGERSSTTTITTTVSTDGSKTSSSKMEMSIAATSSDGSASSGTTSTTNSSSATTSSSSSSNSSSTSSSLTSWFTSSFRDEETQLVVGATSSNTTTGDANQVCDGLPALVTRSSTETPNGGCPDELTALNASCTCLTGYSETANSWVFHVTTESWNSSTSTTTRSLTQSSSDELAINTFRPIWVSSSLEALVIEGAGETPVDLEFIDENRAASGSSLTLVRSASNSSNVSTLSFSNVDLNSVAAKNSDFVPATVTDLTLRNCNISTLSTSFTRDWSSIQYLDLSSNSIDTEYIGGASLKELNLSYNALAVFPSGSLNSSGLQALYIQGNAITDFNVSQEQFEQIQGLTAFTADQAESSSTCQDGAWQSIHGTTFCVLAATTAAVPDSSRSSASGSDDGDDGLGLMAYWLIAGAIIVFFLLLLVIWQRRRHSRESDSSPIVSPEAVEPTTPKYNGNNAFVDALNRDAVATSPAAPAAVRAVSTASGGYVGYGRSHGNSVDSEDTALGASLASNSALTSCRLDYSEVVLGRCISRGGFGLVFVGSYRGRQVAVKKIRNERDVEREQVEQFVGEISLISGLNHPRIVEFIGACWTTPAELSAVTELMERGDLRDVTRRFKRRGSRLTWEAHKAVIALHIAEALTYLHGLSPTVIHRDLKAKNVMLNADMEAKLSDFGIARERSFYDGSEHMTVGIGTSFWIAPEVLLGRDYDERADIYSFGVVLSEIDTDDYPYWNAQNPPQGKVQENEILRLVARGARRPAFSDDCPPAILELAARCLRADPEERPSASEIVLYLQQLVQNRNSSASLSSMRNSFDFIARSSNNSPPTGPAPVNTIVNLQQIQQNQEMTVSSSKAACAAEKHTKKTTTTTRTTTVSSSSIGSDVAFSYRPTAAQALAASHEEVESSPQVTHKVVRTNLPAKGKRTTTTTTTTRRAEQDNTAGHFTTGVFAESSDEDLSFRSFGEESGPSRTTLDNLQQQRQLNFSSGEEERRHEASKWAVYRHDDIREL